jgi:hypothetical protein
MEDSLTGGFVVNTKKSDRTAGTGFDQPPCFFRQRALSGVDAAMS